MTTGHDKDIYIQSNICMLSIVFYLLALTEIKKRSTSRPFLTIQSILLQASKSVVLIRLCSADNGCNKIQYGSHYLYWLTISVRFFQMIVANIYQKVILQSTGFHFGVHRLPSRLHGYPLGILCCAHYVASIYGV